MTAVLFAAAGLFVLAAARDAMEEDPGFFVGLVTLGLISATLCGVRFYGLVHNLPYTVRNTRAFSTVCWRSNRSHGLVGVMTGQLCNRHAVSVRQRRGLPVRFFCREPIPRGDCIWVGVVFGLRRLFVRLLAGWYGGHDGAC